MNRFRKNILSVFCLFVFSGVNSQIFEHFSTHAAPAIYNIKGNKSIFGISIGEECFFFENFKAEISANFSLTNGNGGTYEFKKYNSYTGASTTTSYSKKLSYTSFHLAAGYYLKEPDLTGSNMYIKAGPMLQILTYTSDARELLHKDIDEDLLYTQFNFGLTYGTGYVYTFESGFGLFAFAEYDHRLGDLTSRSDKVLKNTNSLNLGIGVKYNFLGALVPF